MELEMERKVQIIDSIVKNKLWSKQKGKVVIVCNEQSHIANNFHFPVREIPWNYPEIDVLTTDNK